MNLSSESVSHEVKMVQSAPTGSLARYLMYLQNNVEANPSEADRKSYQKLIQDFQRDFSQEGQDGFLHKFNAKIDELKTSTSQNMCWEYWCNSSEELAVPTEYSRAPSVSDDEIVEHFSMLAHKGELPDTKEGAKQYVDLMHKCFSLLKNTSGVQTKYLK